ncbi:MAG: hypothetical protein WCJ01_07655 [Ignavibacteria bacterium]
MGTNKISIIYTTLFFILLTSFMFAQAEYVPYSHPVYNFLERMDSRHILADYNNFELPKTRKAIAFYIKEIISRQSEINKVDKGILEDLKNEFEFELYGTLNHTASLLGADGYNFFSEKEKYFYHLADSSKAAIFINIPVDFESIINHNSETGQNFSAGFIRWGGVIRGTLLNKFGFYMKGSNAFFKGEKSIARNINELKFNYKFNGDKKALTATNYFDNSEGYITADFDLISFKLGRDQRKIGYSSFKNILDVNTPPFDYLSFDMKYKAISFSYFHGKMLGVSQISNDPVQGEINTISDKYVGYHRLGVNLSKDITFGAGELIVYSRRSFDPAYVNPFNFYKSTEHANQDRDNSMLFFDFTNNSIKSLKFYGTVLIDDIDFGKLGTGWYGNQLCYNFSIFSSGLYDVLPVDLTFQYLRIEPYVYTHRILDNNFTSSGYSLADPLQPNSDVFNVGFNYNPHYRVRLALEFSYTRHGANELNPDGNVRRNVGGDVLVGYRAGDDTKVKFLDGIREDYRTLSVSGVFEPVRNYFLSAKVIYENSRPQLLQNNYFAGYLIMNLRI